MCNISIYQKCFLRQSNCSLKKMSPSALCKDILIFSSHTLYTTNFLQKSSDWCIACYRRFFTSLTDRRTAGHWVCLRLFSVQSPPLVKLVSDDLSLAFYWLGSIHHCTWTLLHDSQHFVVNFKLFKPRITHYIFFIVPIYCLIYKVIVRNSTV